MAKVDVQRFDRSHLLPSLAAPQAALLLLPLVHFCILVHQYLSLCFMNPESLLSSNSITKIHHFSFQFFFYFNYIACLILFSGSFFFFKLKLMGGNLEITFSRPIQYIFKKNQSLKLSFGQYFKDKDRTFHKFVM